jgi:YVTN family beta-propeller protein
MAVSVNPSTNIAYVANRDDNTVSVIDGKTNTLKFIK